MFMNNSPIFSFSKTLSQSKIDYFINKLTHHFLSKTIKRNFVKWNI